MVWRAARHYVPMLCASLLPLAALAQDEPTKQPPIVLSGSFQTAFISGKIGGNRKTQHRFSRTELSAKSGMWSASASLWNYPFCDWHDLDETTVRYSSSEFSAKIGRFRLPVGQSTWDDQWYSPFVFLPMIEISSYRGQKTLARTSVGLQVDLSRGPSQFQLAATSNQIDHNQVIASSLKRISGRLSTYYKGTVFGLSGYTSIDPHQTETLGTVDLRITFPHYILRMEALQHNYNSKITSGALIEVIHRPKSWQDVTLAARWEAMQSGSNVSELTTYAIRIRLPLEFDFSANYSSGPSINTSMLGGGWAFGLNKTFRF